MKKIILHLCADIGSDSYFYQLDNTYSVICIGKNIGVENYSPKGRVQGIIANPVCTDFSTAPGFHKSRNMERGLFLVRHCLRIIEAARPVWWVIENPANGRLKDFLGAPTAIYQPWQYGDPWTKKTALWGEFKMPDPLFSYWDDVPKNSALYTRPNRKKPALAFMHKSALSLMPEFAWCADKIHTDADFRSLCAPGFARAFYTANK